MSKKWSSYEKDQLLTESWRSFLETETSPNEKAEELDEGFGDFFKRKKKSSATYPASEFTQLNVALQSANKMLGSPVVNDDLTTELGDYIKSQNFVISEAEEILLGQDLPFDLTKMPTLKKLMDAAKAKPEVLQALKKQFARAGFKERPPTAAGGKPSAAPTAAGGKPSAAPTAAGGGKPPTAPTAGGKPPTAPTAPAEPEPEQSGLKSLSRADKTELFDIIKNFGKLDIKKVRQEIESNISKQLSGNPFAKKIKSEQMPNVMKILDQVEKILTGDFDNLVSESDSKKIINLISEEIIKVLNEQSTTKETD